MLFVKENREKWLHMGIKDADKKCIPAPITAKFKIGPPVFAGDNMDQGIRTMPKAGAKAEMTEAKRSDSTPSHNGVADAPVMTKKASRNDGQKSEKNGAGTVFMIIAAVCAVGAAYYYFFVIKVEE